MRYNICIRKCLFLVLFSLNLILSCCYANKNAAPKFIFNGSSCKTLEPFYMMEQLSVTTTQIPTNDSNSENENPEAAAMEIPRLELVTDDIFKIKLNDTVYRRNRVVQIDLEALSEDMTIEGYAIQIRPVSDSDGDDEEQLEEPKRVGSFMADSGKMEMTQKCDGDQDDDAFLTTGPKFTSNSLKHKNMTTIYWRAPDNPRDKLVAEAAILTTDMKYWKGKSDQTMTFNEFPPSRKKCGLEKSCVRIGKAGKEGCSPDICEYFLTWQLVDDNRTVDFVVGGKLAVNQYLGIGFINAMGKYPFNMTLLSCNRLSQNEAEIKSYFMVDKKTPPDEINLEFHNSRVDPDGNERQWCKFSRPFLPPVPENSAIPPLDFNENYTLIYIIGKLNDSMPLIPDKLTFGGNEGAWSIMEPIMITQVIDIPLSSTGATNKFTLISLFLHILCFLHFTTKSFV